MSEYLSVKTIERVTSEVLRSLKFKEEFRMGIDWIKV